MQGKSWPIANLPRLDESTRSRLEALGIHTTQDLLQKAQTAVEKSAIAQQLQLKPQQINKWLIMADLARVESVGCEYCGLLLHAGIASISQLSQMHPQKLHRQILRLQVSLFKRKDCCPPVETVQKWIIDARQLARSR
ncbi:MAG: DUF4332 domain-containing protein [Cyanobacteria bacterium]|jgi:hypothetical protein|nr:DUF4332 domain-containing protein [Cyanobacteria bacterium GSL.Bin1]